MIWAIRIVPLGSAPRPSPRAAARCTWNANPPYKHPSAALATGTLEGALAAVGGPFLAHSGRGMRYRTRSRPGLCERAGVTRSMSRRGHSPDNAAMEGFLGRLKVETFGGRDWSGWTPDAFAGGLAAYICWCNASRIKAFREGGRTVWDTTDGRRRRLGTAA